MHWGAGKIVFQQQDPQADAGAELKGVSYAIQHCNFNRSWSNIYPHHCRLVSSSLLN